MYKKNGRTAYKSNRRTSFKKPGGYKNFNNRNRGNVSQQYNKYLKLAKEASRSGDRIQSEYYYQFTDHYYRLMIELGITLEDQDNLDETKSSNNVNTNIDEIKDVSVVDNAKLVDDEFKDENEDGDASIESVPFISEPVKKKRTRTQK